MLKKQRDEILCKTDWLFVADNPVPSKHRNYYKEYRQYLRKFDFNRDGRFEEFEHWLRRNYPTLFMDGGDHKEVIERFFHYLR
jgi:hypothetical protein